MLNGKGIHRAREGFIRAGYRFKKIFNQGFEVPPHPLTNFEIQKLLSK